MTKITYAIDVSRDDGRTWSRQLDRHDTAEAAADSAWEITHISNCLANVVQIVEVESVIGGYKTGVPSGWGGQNSNTVDQIWKVAYSGGIDPPAKFKKEDDARMFAKEKRAVPSYLGKGAAGGGTGLCKATLFRVTTIVDSIEEK